MSTVNSPRYPVPQSKPIYVASGHKIAGEKKRSVVEIFEFGFVVVAFALTLWLAWLLLLKGTTWTPSMIGYLIVLWALMAYFALPKLHQFFTSLYVPDYFISRTRTADGLLGDPVNLALEGSAADIHAAMENAGWVKADEITLGSSWGIIKSSVFRRSYPEAPVSDLFLFGQRHAFAYQQEVDGNAAQRHHIRFWPVPEGWVLPGGHHVTWLAAGTYDRAVGLSLFTGQITHKIDANIDLERDYVIDTVRYADPDSSVRVIEEFSTAYHSRNGGGDTVITDGNLPVLDVTGATKRLTSSTPEQPTSENNDVAQDFFSKQVETAKKQPLPPIPFLIMGALLALTNILLIVGWVISAATGKTAVNADEMPDFIAATAIFATMMVFWVLTACRKRWARLLLIAIITINTIDDLHSATVSGSMGISSILFAAIAVFLLWSVCGEAMSRWVSTTTTNTKKQ